MKRNWVPKLALVVVVLTMVSTSLVSGTFAKYVTTVTARDTVTVANWKATLEGKGTTNTTYTTAFDMIGTVDDTGVSGNLLAPGTVGSFAVNWDMTGTQVAHNVTIKLAGDALTNLTYLKFYSDSERETELTPTAGGLEIINTNYAKNGATTGTVTVYWAWAFFVDANQDDADTLDGIAAGTFDVDVIFTATQLDTYPAP